MRSTARGGIGKSTLSANLSAALAAQGKRVLQIGCDPKQDSTRLLLGGLRPKTVLEYLRDTKPEAQRLGDIIHGGWKGIDCVEAGGPEPGVGCAGRGILSAFAILDRLGCVWASYDAILYDVLGDVVCGGFAVPLRKGFSETILIVTSEEFMSLYAANNILRGVRNMEQGEPRSVGLVVNRREHEGDIACVQRFAQSTGVPVLAVLPRSLRFSEAEATAQTLVQAFPESAEAEIVQSLAVSVLKGWAGRPHPLEDDDLERIVLGRTTPVSIQSSYTQPDHFEPTAADSCVHKAEHSSNQRRYLSKSLITREPLHGCAFTGAVNTLTQIRRAVTLAHGPRSCAHIAASTMLSSGLATQRRHGVFIPEQIAPALFSTEMTDATLIHGGLDAFREGLQRATDAHPQAVFVVTTCPVGVIGDDVDQVLEEARGNGISILRIATDGDIEGDYLQGIINACTEGAGSLIDPEVLPGDDCVNIVAEKNIALNADPNFEEMKRLLSMLGLRVHCRFVRRTSVDELRDYLHAPLNLLAYNDHLGRVLREYLSGSFGCVFAKSPFPSGFHETEHWLLEIARFFDREHQADQALETMRREYHAEIEALCSHLAGKRLMLVTYNHDVDWILETAFDLDMEIVRVGIVDYSQDGQYRTRYGDRLSVETGYNPERRAEDIRQLQPDLCLGNYQSSGLPEITHYDTVPLCPDTGHLGGLALARRWSRLLSAPIREGWRKDEARLFGSTADLSGRRPS